MDKIRIGIFGYGNLGRGVERAVLNAPDMELVGVFTRREGVSTATGKAINSENIIQYKDKIDVMILCSGSATDLPEQGPMLLKHFNTVDLFDTHAKIPEYFEKMDSIGKVSSHLGIISVGWDPGLFSIARMLFEAVLPHGATYTFWGKGVSQGHSDAIRRIEGVADARQYTVPLESAMQKAINVENPEFIARDMHKRVCYVVAKEGADKNKIREQIVNMPNYFADYDTTVNFISEEELKLNHSGLPHGGTVIRSGDSYSEQKHVLECKLSLDSNPEFTGSVLTAYARAIYRMRQENRTGCITVFDVPIAKLSFSNESELRARLL